MLLDARLLCKLYGGYRAKRRAPLPSNRWTFPEPGKSPDLEIGSWRECRAPFPGRNGQCGVCLVESDWSGSIESAGRTDDTRSKHDSLSFSSPKRETWLCLRDLRDSSTTVWLKVMFPAIVGRLLGG